MEAAITIINVSSIVFATVVAVGIGAYLGVKVAAVEIRKVLGNATLVSNNNSYNVNFSNKEDVEKFYSALKKIINDETNLKNHP